MKKFLMLISLGFLTNLSVNAKDIEFTLSYYSRNTGKAETIRLRADDQSTGRQLKSQIEKALGILVKNQRLQNLYDYELKYPELKDDTKLADFDLSKGLTLTIVS